ncbi:hypothetical protein FGIG_10787 [Fasciola gigantica]|uniref:Uncharacterized protein n=1 Tax=Fasciola gigantica TaxID=46835 RepID=A0A504YAA0_FASGI|nr:hypothetical protein FGIG_10787 [Fasciola gigantica]
MGPASASSMKIKRVHWSMIAELEEELERFDQQDSSDEDPRKGKDISVEDREALTTMKRTLPGSAMCVQKYVQLRGNLEHPQPNLHWIRLAQLPLIEQLLSEISQDPLQLLQQQQQPKQSQPASKQQQTARFRGSPATTTSATGVDDLFEAHGAAVAGEVHGTVRGSWPGRHVTYGYSGVNGSNSASLNRTLGVPPWK